MTTTEAFDFCSRWLPLWTDNRPEVLIEMYTEDALYRDPARPQGVEGRAALLDYFRKLLARNPDWVWTADEVYPIEGGFTLRWKATIPAGSQVVETTGLDLVFVDDGRISRNEVYFDRVPLLEALKQAR
jgi:hypothetical protein